MVTGGSSGRMKAFAGLLESRLNIKAEEISRTDRFAFFKVGPVICVNVSWRVGGSAAIVLVAYSTE